MVFQRRRQHNYLRLRRLLPTISAVFGSVLLLLTLLSFVAPPPLDIDHLRLRRRRVVSFNNGSGPSGGAVPVRVFHVPANGGRLGRDLWSSRNSEFYEGCSGANHKFAKAENITQPNRYLLIATSGGLNQQRTGITDAVVAARILNATLVVPKLDQKSFWKDASDFSEIFDVDWFISFLAKDVKIVKQLPRRGKKTLTPYTMRVPRKCSDRCYRNRVSPVLLKRHAVQLTKFDYRLANRLETDLQKLRCRVNYHALRFTQTILEMGKSLVHKMRMRSKHYIALHLRFEPDMLAFSGCYYGGGENERKELGKIRRRWKTLHVSNPEKERRHGKCPLTPEEVGLVLRALGYGRDIHLYVASGEVYGGEKMLAPLKALFPNFHSKETIARKEELRPFSTFSSRMAALDFIVCDESDVFVTNNNGNMARILAGRRKYFGHKPTIRPNARKLYRLFLNRDNNMTWEEFASKVRTYQRGFMGEPNEMRPGRGEFHENPSSCICENSEAKRLAPQKQHKKGNNNNNSNKGNATSKLEDPQDWGIEDQQDWFDADEQDQDELDAAGNLNTTDVDYEEPELLEEILSD